MEIKDLIEFLTEIDGAKEVSTNPKLIDSLDDIEKSFRKMKSLLIYTRIKKLMTVLGQKPTDIYVQTMPKAGTTLMQMLLYQMITDGKMNFNHLYDVSPWYAFAARGRLSKFNEFLENPPNFKNRRILKSHLPYSMFKDMNQGKIVYIVQDGKDQLLSNFHQYKNYFEYKLEFENFVDSFMEGWFTTNEEWLKNESQLPIIYINYEDIVFNKKIVIQKLSDFLDIPINKEIVERTIERTSFDFMKKHENKFGEQPETQEHKIYNQFIRKGKVGEGKKDFTKEQIKKYNKLSENYLSSVTELRLHL